MRSFRWLALSVLLSTVLLIGWQGLDGMTFTGCYICKAQFGCSEPTLSRPCDIECEAVGDEDLGTGIYCNQWWTWAGWRCNTSGGGCLNIVVEGEEPECQDICP